MKTLNELRDEIHENAKNKGFWDSPRETGTRLMLCVSELSEAMEADRRGKYADIAAYNECENADDMNRHNYGNDFIADVSGSFTKDEVINILQKRADNAFHSFHEYERNEILKAIDIITRLMPPSSFPDW